MMAARSIDHENLCVLRVSTKVLDLPKVMIADRNAASDYVRFGPAPLALGLIDRTLVFADDWAHPGDQADEWHRKSAKCAEVLVPNRVSPRQLLGAYASCVVSQEILGNIAPQLDVILNPRLFFH